MYWLLMMKILIGKSYCTAVDISCMVISTEASPAISMTSELGCASCTPTRGRQSVAHGAEAAGGHPAVGLLELIELRRPHLVLAHFRGDVGVAVLGQLVEPSNGVLRLDQLVRVFIGERLAGPPLFCMLPPDHRARLFGEPSRAVPQPPPYLSHSGA